MYVNATFAGWRLSHFIAELRQDIWTRSICQQDGRARARSRNDYPELRDTQAGYLGTLSEWWTGTTQRTLGQQQGIYTWLVHSPSKPYAIWLRCLARLLDIWAQLAVQRRDR